MNGSTRQHAGTPLRRGPGRRHLQAVPRPTLVGVWDRHGTSLYTFACALTGNETAAAQAVTLAMADLARSTNALSTLDVRRTLVERIFAHSQELVLDSSTTRELPPAMLWLREVAPLQRASLALCLFGGLTHREAAELMGVAPVTVAELLTAGLRELGGLSSTIPVAG